tara:strand:+ start:312 stop:671 length:360 start_codon:yes stop_codon:yes gene_type:complete
MKDNIFTPINLTGNMPVPKILLQHIFTTDREARFYQTNGKIVKSSSNTIWCDIEPSKIQGIRTAIHLGFPEFKEIIEAGRIVTHNSKKPRFDVYIPLEEFDKFVEKYLKWRKENETNTN